MRAWVLAGGFGHLHLRQQEQTAASLGPTQLRLRMKAWSINYRDHLVVAGQYNPRVRLPLVPLSDGVGVVSEKGSQAERFPIGARVMPIFAPNWLSGPPTRAHVREALGCPLDGTLQTELVVEESSVVEAPTHLSDAEAATLPCAAVTAWNALQGAGVQAGDAVLVEGTGGVALFALQFAHALGATTIVTSKSDHKLERARGLGADHVINYTRVHDWGKHARELADGAGIQCTIDVGGEHTIGQAIAATRPGGSVAVIGILSGPDAQVSLVRLMMNQLRLQGVFVGSRADLESMCRFVSAKQLTPVVDSTFPFEAFPRALEELTKGRHFGKIAITP